MATFQALVVNEDGESVTSSIQSLTTDDLPEGEVLIRVHYSSVNYKDGLASIREGNIVSSYPFVPGIDLAGVVESSSRADVAEGSEVIVTSYELGVSHYGGFSEYARVPADWVVPLPEGMSLREAMIYGTAGFTAGLSILQLEEAGVTPDSGRIVVTGATGGVGSMAVAMLAARGYSVAASTGKAEEHDYLRRLGAEEILGREDVLPEKIRPLDKERWAGAVDPVGGETLAYLLSATKRAGAVAVSGLTGGTKVPTTVFPFILRGVSLLGVDSAYCEMTRRKKVWEHLASDYKPTDVLAEIGEDIDLHSLPSALEDILNGEVRGRKIVKLV
ncbi:putative YhdH/YhfP family quinone oxidoreductase [Salsuginibacillus halophilus]|uniref:Putative YhdH/YhfP family quinone oxidoreductase n=1 Tax=Salsuginibacillus halophilus TaxID=517424 RepID=A0A2P8HLF5_9BACI|nr:acryloyl-CoA reductase [Salsuginibacillus halophilus]PSL47021.1 putative YhdH/YhfP family quinone oxidoreductase [Salsuginibacillus halophilus]